MKKILLLSLFFIVIDQIIKLLIDKFINLGETVYLIKDFFNLMYVRNTGAAFSIFTNNTLILGVISLIFTLIVLYLIKFDNDKLRINKTTTIIYSLLLGGIVGNMIDRLFRGFIIDYLSFNIFGYYFPIFNLADSFIVIGCLLYFIITIKEETHGNNSRKQRK